MCTIHSHTVNLHQGVYAGKIVSKTHSLECWHGNKKWGRNPQYTIAGEWLFKLYHRNPITFYTGAENYSYKTM